MKTNIICFFLLLACFCDLPLAQTDALQPCQGGLPSCANGEEQMVVNNTNCYVCKDGQPGELCAMFPGNTTCDGDEACSAVLYDGADAKVGYCPTYPEAEVETSSPEQQPNRKPPAVNVEINVNVN